jgi:hypothetical protein
LAEAALRSATPNRHDLHDLTIPCALDPGTELSPLSYQQLALCEQVAAPVSGLDLVLDRMGRGHLDLLAREGCSLSRPIAERGALYAKKLRILAGAERANCRPDEKHGALMKNMELCRRGRRQKSSRAWPAVRVGDDLD